MGALSFSWRFKLGSQLPTPGSWHEMDMCLRDSTVFPSDPHTGVFPWGITWSQGFLGEKRAGGSDAGAALAARFASWLVFLQVEGAVISLIHFPIAWIFSVTVCVWCVCVSGVCVCAEEPGRNSKYTWVLCP